MNPDEKLEAISKLHSVGVMQEAWNNCKRSSWNGISPLIYYDDSGVSILGDTTITSSGYTLDTPSGMTDQEYIDSVIRENEQLKKQVEELEKDNDELSDSFITMEEEISTLKEELRKLKT